MGPRARPRGCRLQGSGREEDGDPEPEAGDEEIVEQVPKCSKCDRIFPTIARMERHQSECRGEGGAAKLPCPACGKLFNTTHNMNLHLDTTCPSLKPTFKCKWCPRELGSEVNLTRHMRKCSQGGTRQLSLPFGR
eukprot:TRINITY_DN47311_c0_g1_i1.p3 TRINITY_DN47311_c0_g1~~TRINITY_DN47311_c0_g1_i1.p3  ORF type:complete len:135 (+),score=23.70 TRINITY_DN47311_c0_g1_i1:71-475(+)